MIFSTRNMQDGPRLCWTVKQKNAEKNQNQNILSAREEFCANGHKAQNSSRAESMFSFWFFSCCFIVLPFNTAEVHLCVLKKKFANSKYHIKIKQRQQLHCSWDGIVEYISSLPIFYRFSNFQKRISAVEYIAHILQAWQQSHCCDTSEVWVRFNWYTELLPDIPPDSDEDTQERDTDDDYVPNSAPKVSDKLHLELPGRKLLYKSSELATRLHLSHRQATAMTSSFVKIGGGSLSDCSLSISTSHRQWLAADQSRANEIRSKFQENVPEHILFHRDGKVIKYEHHHETEDRLAIVTSLPGRNQNDQFLAAPRIQDGKGTTMSDALQATLHEWTIPSGNLEMLSYGLPAAIT